MKSPRFAFGSVLGLVLWVSLLPAVSQAGDSPLEKAMKNMQDAKKELYPAMKTPVPADKAKYIALATTLKTEGEKSKDLIPEMAEKLPAAEKDAMVTGYRKDMDVFIQTTNSLIEALQKDQWDQATAIVAKMKDEEKAGHKAYRPKKERSGPGGSGEGQNPTPAQPAPAAN